MDFIKFIIDIYLIGSFYVFYYTSYILIIIIIPSAFIFILNIFIEKFIICNIFQSKYKLYFISSTILCITIALLLIVIAVFKLKDIFYFRDIFIIITVLSNLVAVSRSVIFTFRACSKKG